MLQRSSGSARGVVRTNATAAPRSLAAGGVYRARAARMTFMDRSSHVAPVYKAAGRAFIAGQDLPSINTPIPARRVPLATPVRATAEGAVEPDNRIPATVGLPIVGSCVA